MRLSLLCLLIVFGVLVAPVPQPAAAAPVAAARVIPAVASGFITKVYYYRGQYYPYYYRGGYYPYRYGGRYYRHRYYRYGHWHYY